MRFFIWSTSFMWMLLLFIAGVEAQVMPKTVGIYDFPLNTGFSYASDRSFGENYVFEHPQKNISIYLIKEPIPVNGKSTLNTNLYDSLLSFYNLAFYQEKGKSSSYRQKFLSSKKANFSRYGRIKELKSNEKVYLLFYTIDNLLYRIMILAETGKKDPPMEAKEFLESVKLAG